MYNSFNVHLSGALKQPKENGINYSSAILLSKKENSAKQNRILIILIKSYLLQMIEWTFTPIQHLL